MLLTDDLLLHYKRCQRRAFLDVYGDSTQKNPAPDFLLKLRQDSLTHKQGVLGMLKSCPGSHSARESPLSLGLPAQLSIGNISAPNYPRDDWASGARATVELMEQGIDCIAQPVLLVHNDQGLTLLSCPALLVKQPGQSRFGDWMYVPVDIKFGRRPKADYQIIATFHCQVLASVQGVWPDTAWLILRRKYAHAVNLAQWLPVMVEVLADCVDTLEMRQEPEVFISRQKCSLCHWYNSCYAIAQSQQHISLLPGVSPNRYRDLQDLGITTVASLAQAQLSILEPVFGREIAAELFQQAQATLENRVIVRQKYHSLVREADFDALIPGCSTGVDISPNLATSSVNGKVSHSLSSPDILPRASVEMFFDIEAQPDLNLDYLLGILVIDHANQSEIFYPLLAENPQDEAAIWHKFLDLVWLYPDAPIFHFSVYEVETVKRLAKLYNTPLWRFQPLLSRFVDLHHRIINTVLLPVESYSLKHLGRWLGFEWREASITGSQCVFLYDQWLATGDRTLLDLIQRYNEDDCRATYHLKNWLSGFLQDRSNYQ